MKRSTPLRRKTALKRTASLKAAPVKRLEPERTLAVWCELGLPGCTFRAVDRHERKRRAQGGDGSPSNTIDVCRHCHDRIHLSPFHAYANGWMVEHFRDSSKVPVRRRNANAAETQTRLEGL